MTAEGDNSVLMQKVTKERLAKFKQLTIQKPDKEDLTDYNYLHYLLQCREDIMFTELGQKLQVAGKSGLFDTWMYDESDLIQGAARAYGERLVCEQFTEAYNTADPALRAVLHQLRNLFLIDIIEKDLGWFLSHGVLPLEAGRSVNKTAAALCKELSPHALSLCDSFKIPDAMLSAPIALDWVTYNQYDNQGEV